MLCKQRAPSRWSKLQPRARACVQGGLHISYKACSFFASGGQAHGCTATAGLQAARCYQMRLVMTYTQLAHMPVGGKRVDYIGSACKETSSPEACQNWHVLQRILRPLALGKLLHAAKTKPKTKCARLATVFKTQCVSMGVTQAQNLRWSRRSKQLPAIKKATRALRLAQLWCRRRAGSQPRDSKCEGAWNGRCRGMRCCVTPATDSFACQFFSNVSMQVFHLLEKILDVQPLAPGP